MAENEANVISIDGNEYDPSDLTDQQKYWIAQVQERGIADFFNYRTTEACSGRLSLCSQNHLTILFGRSLLRSHPRAYHTNTISIYLPSRSVSTYGHLDILQPRP